MRPRHTHDPICLLCEEKLATAHASIADWFRRAKGRHPTIHVSWAWRGPEDQERFKAQGLSRASFGQSLHNHMDGDKPCSKALDLFELTQAGVARWDTGFFFRLNDENEAAKEPLRWGGKFSRLGDFCHFEMLEPKGKAGA